MPKISRVSCFTLCALAACATLHCSGTDSTDDAPREGGAHQPSADGACGTACGAKSDARANPIGPDDEAGPGSQESGSLASDDGSAPFQDAARPDDGPASPADGSGPSRDASSSRPDSGDGGSVVPPLGHKITPGEVNVPNLTYDRAPLIVTSAAFGGHGKTASDPLVVKNCKIRSDTTDTPAIIIGEPGLTVVIDGCTLVGGGHVLISAGGFTYNGTHYNGSAGRLTVQNTSGYGLPSTVAGRGRPRFISGGSPKSLRIEHNYLEHLSGIYIFTPAPGEPFLFRYNRAKDMDARTPDTATASGGNGAEGGEGHFVFLTAKGTSVPNVDISWNEIVNFPDESAGGDYVNLYTFSGTEQSPVDIHHNFVKGAYPYPSAYQGHGCVHRTNSGGSAGYTGSGFTTDGHPPPITGPNDVTTWAIFHDNRLVNICNGAINLVQGNNTKAYHNRIVHSGVLDNADKTPASGMVPGAVYDVYHIGTDYYHDNQFYENEFWWPKAGQKIPGAGTAGAVHDNIDLAATKGVGATLADEDAEYDAFLIDVKKAGLSTGPQ